MENLPDNENITDLNYLVDLSKGNKQFVKDMVQIFLEENPLEIEMLERGIKNRDFNLINASAHKLRSTVPFVGLDKYIEKEISEIERLAVNKSASELPREKQVEEAPSDNEVIIKMDVLFDKIRTTCSRACDELMAYATE